MHAFNVIMHTKLSLWLWGILLTMLNSSSIHGFHIITENVLFVFSSDFKIVNEPTTLLLS